MEHKTVDESKLAVHATLGDIADAVCRRLEIKKELPVSTEVLCEELGLSASTIIYYHSLGMPKVGHNRWLLTVCQEWISTEYPKIISKPGRKKK